MFQNVICPFALSSVACMDTIIRTKDPGEWRQCAGNEPCSISENEKKQADHWHHGDLFIKLFEIRMKAKKIWRVFAIVL